MPKLFHKRKECGCIIETICCGIKTTEQGKMYLLGGHQHFIICHKCKQDEENEEDTLNDMWLNDNITNNSEYNGWRVKKL